MTTTTPATRLSVRLNDSSWPGGVRYRPSDLDSLAERVLRLRRVPADRAAVRDTSALVAVVLTGRHPDEVVDAIGDCDRLWLMTEYALVEKALDVLGELEHREPAAGQAVFSALTP